MQFVVFISFLLSVCCNTACAETIASPNTLHEQYLFGAVSSMAVRTIPIKQDNEANISKCLINVSPSAPQACIRLLKNNTCRNALIDLLESSSPSKKRTRRAQATCFNAYCPSLGYADRHRVCSTPMKTKSLNETIDFYATAIRQYFVHVSDVHGLKNSQAIAYSMVWTLRR